MWLGIRKGRSHVQTLSRITLNPIATKHANIERDGVGGRKEDIFIATNRTDVPCRARSRSHTAKFDYSKFGDDSDPTEEEEAQKSEFGQSYHSSSGVNQSKNSGKEVISQSNHSGGF